jgi:hypothetical protein
MTVERPLYEDRDSINPRAFAVRHMIIETVKTRLRRGGNGRAVLERIARGAGVEYDATTRSFVISLEGNEVRRMPLDSLALYVHGDDAGRANDVRHWDTVLEENRRIVGGLVDEMARRIEGASA